MCKFLKTSSLGLFLFLIPCVNANASTTKNIENPLTINMSINENDLGENSIITKIVDGKIRERVANITYKVTLYPTSGN